jgi:hypothetical protein
MGRASRCAQAVMARSMLQVQAIYFLPLDCLKVSVALS